MSAMRPILPYYYRPFIPLLKPDVILTQSLISERMFSKFGIKTVFFPSGVDIDRFKPVLEKEKNDLKNQYNISEYKFIILHIGSIKEGRNLRQLIKLQDNETQVLIIGAGSKKDNTLFKDLTDAGCIVLKEYIQHIEKIYNCADCYIFPTVDKYDFFGRAMADSIEMPLTVLEAMACNLPVISSRFGAIPRIFSTTRGFFLFSNQDELIYAIQEIKKKPEIKTREIVISYSWEKLTITLENIYAECIKG
jgi:glycosyltransferase involved in cell wall biosynthesis